MDPPCEVEAGEGASCEGEAEAFTGEAPFGAVPARGAEEEGGGLVPRSLFPGLLSLLAVGLGSLLLALREGGSR